jgi:DNA-binding NarL/FixJ family response regulator
VTAPLGVLVADDDADYRFLVRLGLEGDGVAHVVAEAADSHDLVANAAASAADIVLVDCSMRGALAAVPAVRDLLPDARVVLVSSLPSTELLLAAPGAGAVGFVTKDLPITQLGTALLQLAPLLDAASRILATTQRALPDDAASARAARRLTQDVLRPWIDDDTLETAVLAVSELVTNSVVHAQSEVDVRVCVLRDAVRIEVGDASPVVPTMRHAELHDTSGRGIALVAQLSSRWGVRPRRLGKTVWFELPRPIPVNQ